MFAGMFALARQFLPLPGAECKRRYTVTGKLILVRHGQSVWNVENLFTGWHDVDLTDKGRAEASAAGATMAEAGLRFDIAHSSVQTRAVARQRGLVSMAARQA